MNELTALPAMKSNQPPPPDSIRPGIWLAGILGLGCLLLLMLVAILRPGTTSPSATQTTPGYAPAPMTATHSDRGPGFRIARRDSVTMPARPAEEVVAEKLNQ